MMTSPSLLPLATALLYLLGGLLPRPTAAQPNHVAPLSLSLLPTLLAFVLHSLLLLEILFQSNELRFGFGQALSVMLWLAVLLYGVERLFYRIEGMRLPILLAAALCAPLPALFPGMPTPAYTASLEFRIHLALGMAAYSLFTIAAIHALLMALQEGQLHRREGNGDVAQGSMLASLFSLLTLPPLLTMEALLFRILGAGFVLLSLTLLTGVLFSETLFGQALQFNHKTLFALLSWLIFGGLLTGRWLRGWRGRQALRWTLAGFIALLLAYVGSRFVLEVVLQRGLH
jgi:ABC-type uncharacterized transport system permease subunit